MNKPKNEIANETTVEAAASTLERGDLESVNGGCGGHWGGRRGEMRFARRMMREAYGWGPQPMVFVRGGWGY